ncbi:MAG: hypothetical protein ABSF67_12960 [Roseiarcus sp.]|jgi:hypothetical protein
MVPWWDIAGLTLGAATAILSPFLIFFALRRRFLIEPRFVVLGVMTTIAESYLFPIVFLAFLSAVDVLIGAITTKSVPGSRFLLVFELSFAHPAVSALVHLTFGVFILAILTPRDKAGLPALAFGVGAFGWTSCLRGWGDVQHLITALAVNDQGLAATFGTGVDVSPSTFANMFTLGVPNGAAAVAQFMIFLMLLMVAWGGWRSYRWKWVAAAYGLALGLAALGALIEAFAGQQPILVPWQAWSLVGVTEAYQSACGLVAVLVLFRFWGFFVALVSAESPNRIAKPRRSGDDEGGSLLAVWKAQSRRE